MGFAGALDVVTASTRLVLGDVSRPLAGLRGLASGRALSLALFDHPQMHAYVARILEERPISAVFVYSGQMAQYVPTLPSGTRSEEHTSELQSLMRISNAVFCLKTKKKQNNRLENITYITKNK